MREADASGAAAINKVFVDNLAKMFEDGRDGDGNDLAEAADRRQLQGMGEFIE